MDPTVPKTQAAQAVEVPPLTAEEFMIVLALVEAKAMAIPTDAALKLAGTLAAVAWAHGLRDGFGSFETLEAA